MKRLLWTLITLLIFYFPATLFAETIILKSGKQIEAKIIEKTDRYIRVDFYGVTLNLRSPAIHGGAMKV